MREVKDVNKTLTVYNLGHATSTYMHEAGLAVAKVAPESFWNYSLALFRAQTEYYDVPTISLTPQQIRDKLVELGKTSGALSSDQAAAVKDALTLKGEGNCGIDVTDNLKACST